jgi:AcrR family transcriptional regulator
LSRGRPRAFDPHQALDSALKVFWRKGYEGASLPDLTKAMGINRPSLYAAFGNKEQLFRKALDRYATGPAGYFSDALAQPTARKVVEHLFSSGIDMVSNPTHPRGCFLVQGALACGDDADCVRRELVRLREATVTKLRQRFKRAKSEGDLPADANPAALARYVATVMHGIAVQAASGASAPELRRVATLALRAWPS